MKTKQTDKQDNDQKKTDAKGKCLQKTKRNKVTIYQLV